MRYTKPHAANIPSVDWGCISERSASVADVVSTICYGGLAVKWDLIIAPGCIAGTNIHMRAEKNVSTARFVLSLACS